MSQFYFQNKTNRSFEFEQFGLDYMGSYDQSVTDMSQIRGGRMGQAGNGLNRINEISRARDLSTLSTDELEQKYNPFGNLAVSQDQMDLLDPDTLMLAQADSAPKLSDWQNFPEDSIQILTKQEAEERYGLNGRLTFEDGVSNLEAWILYERKLEEVRYNHVLNRAEGGEFWKGMGIEVGMALIDPVNLVIGVAAAPIGATALLGRLGWAGLTGWRGAVATRSVYGALGGFYSGVATEPFLYGAAKQEQADYTMLNSLFNITFATAGGAGIANVFGGAFSGVGHGYRYLTRARHNQAIVTAVNQIDNGMDVQVAPITQTGQQPAAPVAKPKFQTEGTSEAAVKMQGIVDEDVPNVRIMPDEGDATPLSPIQKVDPNPDGDVALAKVAEVEKAAPLTQAKMNKLVAEDPELRDALLETLQPSNTGGKKLSNRFAFRVITEDGKVLLISTNRGKALKLFDSETIANIDPSNPIESLGNSIHMSAMMHGADISQSNFKYHGSYGDMSPNSVTHVIDVLGAKFDPEMNVNSVILADPTEVPSILQDSALAQAFSDFVPKGKAAVHAANLEKEGPMLGTGEQATALDGWDMAVNAENLKQIGDQAGTQKGGVFVDKGNGVEYYVKFPDNPDQAVNEFLAANLYRLFGVEFPTTRLVMKDGKVFGVASEMMPGAKTITPDEFLQLPEATRKAFIKNAIVDMYLGNWDVVGNAPNFNMALLPSGSVVRIDPGGALNYRAQGAAKRLTDDLAELSTMLDDGKAPTAAKVFKSSTASKADWDELVQNAVETILTTHPRMISDVIQGSGIKNADSLTTVLEIRRGVLEKKFPAAGKAAMAKHQKYFKAFSHQDGINHVDGYAKKIYKVYTESEVKALAKYGGSWSEEINAYSQMSPEQQIKYGVDQYSKAYDQLVKAMARAESTIQEPLKLWRGGTPTTAFNGINGLKLRNKYDLKTAKAMTGGTVSWDIFMSSSTSESFATGWKSHLGPLIEFRNVPAGTKAIYGSKGVFPHLQSEAEVLLDRGLTLKVVAATKLSDGRVKFIMDVLPEGFVEQPKLDKGSVITMAKHWRENGQTNATSDTRTPLDLEDDGFIQAVLRKGQTIDDEVKITGEIETLKADILAELQNMDDSLVAAFAKELEQADLDATANIAYFQDMHKAAKAAAVCVRGGGA